MWPNLLYDSVLLYFKMRITIVPGLQGYGEGSMRACTWRSWQSEWNMVTQTNVSYNSQCLLLLKPSLQLSLIHVCPFLTAHLKTHLLSKAFLAKPSQPGHDFGSCSPAHLNRAASGFAFIGFSKNVSHLHVLSPQANYKFLKEEDLILFCYDPPTP